MRALRLLRTTISFQSSSFSKTSLTPAILIFKAFHPNPSFSRSFSSSSLFLLNPSRFFSSSPPSSSSSSTSSLSISSFSPSKEESISKKEGGRERVQEEEEGGWEEGWSNDEDGELVLGKKEKNKRQLQDYVTKLQREAGVELDQTTGYPKNKRIPISLSESDISEVFSIGGGRGGQAMQKTSNKVTLQHSLSGLVIRCHKTRNLENNRSAARKILSERLDKLVNGPLSKSSKKGEKLRKKKGKPKITSSATSSPSSKPLEGKL